MKVRPSPTEIGRYDFFKYAAFLLLALLVTALIVGGAARGSLFSAL